MADKIDSATPEQWEQVEQLKQKWIDTQTLQHPDREIRDVVKRMWKSMDLPEPTILITDSPISMVVWGAVLSQVAKRPLKWTKEEEAAFAILKKANAFVQDPETGLVTGSLKLKVDKQLTRLMEALLGDWVRNGMKLEVGKPLKDLKWIFRKPKLDKPAAERDLAWAEAMLWHRTEVAFRETLESTTKEILQESSKEQPWYIGYWWRTWSAWYAGAKIFGVKFDEETLSLFTDWADKASCWVASNGLAIVARNPVEVHWQDEKLHNTSGPAVLYQDGYSHYAIEGIPLDEQVVMRPETQTIEQLNSESNADARAIRIERFGWARYIQETDARDIDVHENAIEGTIEAIYKFPFQGGHETRLIATCATGRVMSMLLPDEITTCASAQQWLCGDSELKCVGRT